MQLHQAVRLAIHEPLPRADRPGIHAEDLEGANPFKPSLNRRGVILVPCRRDLDTSLDFADRHGGRMSSPRRWRFSAKPPRRRASGSGALRQNIWVDRNDTSAPSTVRRRAAALTASLRTRVAARAVTSNKSLACVWPLGSALASPSRHGNDSVGDALVHQLRPLAHRKISLHLAETRLRVLDRPALLKIPLRQN